MVWYCTTVKENFSIHNVPHIVRSWSERNATDHIHARHRLNGGAGADRDQEGHGARILWTGNVEKWARRTPRQGMRQNGKRTTWKGAQQRSTAKARKKGIQVCVRCKEYGCSQIGREGGSPRKAD